MSYRNILVEVDASKQAIGRIEAAATMAKRFGAAMTGAFLRSEVLPNYMISDVWVFVPAENVQQFSDERTKATNEALSVARRTFDEAARDAGVPFYWLDINGDSNEALVACARTHDLTVLPRSMKAPCGEVAIHASDVAMASGGPVLVMPQTGYTRDIGRRILVAWKDTRETARALRDASPFLATADEVHLLQVSRDAEADSDELLARHLRLHGCKNVKHIIDRGQDAPTGEIIRRHAAAVNADLVVLGLYGHSRLQEFVLGGVSQDLLEHLPVPLLVSH
jgi:nucleotide-binding universal stress UspA family protein